MHTRMRAHAYTHAHTHTKCCIQLAQGRLTPDQLMAGVLTLVSARQPRHLSDPTLSLDDMGDGRPSAEIIRMMHKLPASK